jgi:alpha/beta superfamily hydrolase
VALRGQLLERSVVIPCEGDCLDGIYLRGSLGALLIAAPLPDEGGSMASPVSNELAYAAARSECASLRLDYRGVGGSEGAPPESLADAARDLREGVSFLCESVGTPRVAVASYGSGAWAALQLAVEDKRVDRLLLVAPDVHNRPPETPSLRYVDLPTLVVAAGDEPSFELGAFMNLLDEAPNAKLEVFPERRHFRSELVRLARLVPGWMGVVDREREAERDEDGRRRGRLF